MYEMTSVSVETKKKCEAKKCGFPTEKKKKKKKILSKKQSKTIELQAVTDETSACDGLGTSLISL
jgi:hypothetical protein